MRRKGRLYGLAAAVAALIFAGGGFVIVNTWQTEHAVQTVQMNHAGTLSAIHADVKQLKKLTDQVHKYQEESAQGKTEVGKLLILAGQEVAALNAKLNVLCVKVGANC